MINTQRISIKIKVLEKSRKITEIKDQGANPSALPARHRETLQTPRMGRWAGSVGAFAVAVGGGKVDWCGGSQTNRTAVTACQRPEALLKENHAQCETVKQTNH